MPDIDLRHGDCLDVLRELPDASVDACVTDPPYLLGFMGRAWDTRAAHEHLDWHRAWCDEAFRVLKPGGHLLAFGGTRTWHRLACAIEDAGFEVRDSIAWMYGSGFPKSLDVSKAIDKARDDKADVLAVTSRLAELAEAAGITRADIDAHMGTSDMGGWWLSRLPHRCACPSVDNWTRLRDFIPGASDLDAEVWRLNGRKGSPGEAWDQREKIGEKTSAIATPGDTNRYTVGGSRSVLVDITAPATDAARTWQGWGTALKPAHEPVVCARKPLNAVPLDWRLVANVHHALAGLLWLSLSPAKRAELLSPSSQAERDAGWCASALVSAATATSPEGFAAMGTCNSPALLSTSSSIASSWSSILAALSAPTRTSTTSTASSTTTALRTLNSLLAPITSQTTMPPCGCLLGGSASTVASAEQGSTDEWASWLHTLSASAPESAIEGIAVAAASVCAQVAESLSDDLGAGSSAAPSATTGADASGSPAHEPIVVARKPLAGNVAANVLAHGTGALNVDGCRIGTEDTLGRAKGGWLKGGYVGGESPQWDSRGTTVEGGRWPANVVLDESQAAALDEQSGELTSGKMRAGTRPKGERETYGQDAASGYETQHDTPGDSGGASRFFYVAKADASERVRVNGTAHPTVKPLALMRWLVRLVTPPGGTVLEPFAGSGTTVEACLLEGFNCIAIEREADYLPLIRQRINRRRDPVEAVKAAGEDGGLFDLLGEEPA